MLPPRKTASVLHAEEAERLLSEALQKRAFVIRADLLAQGNLHASLAVYYQNRENERNR